MKFDLAQQLRDAGFPQEGCSTYWMKHDGEEPYTIHPRWNNRTVQSYREGYPLSEIVAAPILEELIEACGDEFGGLQYGVNFEAEGGKLWFTANYELTKHTQGNSPIEAISKFFIAFCNNK